MDEVAELRDRFLSMTPEDTERILELERSGYAQSGRGAVVIASRTDSNGYLTGYDLGYRDINELTDLLESNGFGPAVGPAREHLEAYDPAQELVVVFLGDEAIRTERLDRHSVLGFVPVAPDIPRRQKRSFVDRLFRR